MLRSFFHAQSKKKRFYVEQTTIASMIATWNHKKTYETANTERREKNDAILISGSGLRLMSFAIHRTSSHFIQFWSERNDKIEVRWKLQRNWLSWRFFDYELMMWEKNGEIGDFDGWKWGWEWNSVSI